MVCRNYLSACLCFKDASRYLGEWLAFHAALGVEHFYLYDNDSTDDIMPVLAPYLANGMATLTAYSGAGVQQEIYAHCLDTYGRRTRWLMFCDDDEFLFPVRDVSLPAALAPYERFAGVAVAWLLYGSSGHRAAPPGLVVENFTWRAGGADQHVKCIVDPARVLRPVLIGHQFACAEGEVIVDENGTPMHGPFADRPSADILRINHYLTKSLAEMIERRSRIQANTGKVSPLSLEQWIALEANWSAVHDPLATRYAGRVRARLATEGWGRALVTC